jgi:hypothetical protein
MCHRPQRYTNNCHSEPAEESVSHLIVKDGPFSKLSLNLDSRSYRDSTGKSCTRYVPSLRVTV